MHTTSSIRFPLLAAAALAAMGALAGCQADPAPAIAKSNVEIIASPRDTTDPFGSCQIGAGEDPNFPLVCSNGHAPCTGASEGTSCGAQGCGPQIFHVMCDNACDTDADCPVPLTGTSRGSCNLNFHFCRLPCTTDAECPTGSTCQDGTQWLATSASGSLGLPGMCMQTITIQPRADGGA